MPRVLLIDDDVDLTEMLSLYLAREGFEVHAVHDGESGAIEATRDVYSIVVLDIMMPHTSGIEALRRIRAVSQVPVLMLTARGENLDRIVGLDMGADDYVPKPCTPGELAARLRAILRRTEGRDPAGAVGPQVLEVGELTVWPGSRRAEWRGQALDLTGTEFNLLDVLARHAGQLVSKDTISQQAFGQPLARFDRRIDVHISSIRQKLAAHAPDVDLIKTVRGMGYQFTKD